MIVTIDLAKGENTAYFRKVQGQDLKLGKFKHTRAEYQRVYEQVMKFKMQQKCNDVLVCMESTSVYGIPLQHFFMNKPVRLLLINPLHTKRAKEIIDNTPNKTDDKDPMVMADIAQLGRFLSVVIPEGIVADIRNLMHCRERIQLKINTAYNQLHDLLFTVFPEFLQVFPDLRTHTALGLLKEFTIPAKILSIEQNVLEKKIFGLSKGRLRDIKKKSEILYLLAKTSVGVRHGCGSTEWEIHQLIKEIENADAAKDAAEKQISELVKNVSYYKYIVSIPRIGLLTAAAIIGEFAYLDSFKTIDEVMKFAGLNLFEISSGKCKSNCRISKRGRSLLRKYLYYASLNMIRKGGIFHETYKAYHSSNRMKHTEAIIAVSRKLLRILFALVRDEKEYISGYNVPMTNGSKAA
jgi:transposase